MANKTPMRLEEFWKEVYVAAIRSGNGTGDAAMMADAAVAKFLERE
jgi:hypothetical protein